MKRPFDMMPVRLLRQRARVTTAATPGSEALIRWVAILASAVMLVVPAARAAEALAQTKKAPAGLNQQWESLFDGRTLKGWRETGFAGHGEVEVKDGQILIGLGEMLSGVNWTNSLPRMDYELALETMKLDGSDFFCGLTFPVGTNCCTLILGGWGGALVGISSLDHQDASENETTQFVKFDKHKWYRVRVKVTKRKLEAWLDDERIVNVETEGRKIDMRPGDIELSQPLGLATYQTSAAFRSIRLRKLGGSPPPASQIKPK